MRWLLPVLICGSACSLQSIDSLTEGERVPASPTSTRPSSGGTVAIGDAGADASGGNTASAGVGGDDDDAVTEKGGSSARGGVGATAGFGANAGAAGAVSSSGSGGTMDCGGICVPTFRLHEGGVTPRRGGTGGSPIADLCPADEPLIGFTGYVASDGWIEALAAICGAVTISGQASDELSISHSTTLPLRGGRTGSEFSRTCPRNQVVVGFDGRSGLLLDQLIVFCAPLSVEHSASGHSMVLGDRGSLQAVGSSSGGNAFADTICPDDELARGAVTRSGAGLDALALVCATPELAFEPVPH